jgi:DNA-binding transcriptional ArsR family regulator
LAKAERLKVGIIEQYRRAGLLDRRHSEGGTRGPALALLSVARAARIISASPDGVAHFDLELLSKRSIKFFVCIANRRCYILNQMVKYSSRMLNRTFAALADPTRRRILEHLARGDRCVTDLARPHAMSLPAVSKHLRVLEKAGLLRRRRYGRVHEMQLEAKPLKQAAQWVEEYRKFWEGSLDRLAEYLERTNKQSRKKGAK